MPLLPIKGAAKTLLESDAFDVGEKFICDPEHLLCEYGYPGDEFVICYVFEKAGVIEKHVRIRSLGIMKIGDVWNWVIAAE